VAWRYLRPYDAATLEPAKEGSLAMATTKDRVTHTAAYVKSDTHNAVFMGNPMIDDMMTAIISLSSDLWAVKRRQKVMESLLAEKGITTEMVENYMPTEAERAEWQSERDTFIRRTFSHMARTAEVAIDAPQPK
jgi:hypothetical protein